MSTPTRELTKEEQEFLATIQSRFFLFPRKTIIGAALAFLLAVGIVSYKSALVAVTDPAVQAAKKSVLDAQKESETALVTIRANLEKSREIESRIASLENQMPTKLPKDAEFRLSSVGTDNYIGFMDGRTYQPNISFLILRNEPALVCKWKIVTE